MTGMLRISRGIFVWTAYSLHIHSIFTSVLQIPDNCVTIPYHKKRGDHTK